MPYKKRSNSILGRISLVGCGTGDVDLLTLKAYRLIKEADVVLTDHLVSQEIVSLIPQKTMQVFVGKRKGYHSLKQEKINELLIDYASQGLHVARLKAGDPYIFGRGAEEAQAMIEAGYDVEVIPGISSAIAGPLSAGIAPTARGYAANMSIVSAHLSGNSVNLEWVDLLLKKSHTTIVLMGVSRAQEIVQEARNLGVNEDCKVAIISNASRTNQSEIITTLSGLQTAAIEAPRPAILVFGEVVALHKVLPKYQYFQENSDERTAASI